MKTTTKKRVFEVSTWGNPEDPKGVDAPRYGIRTRLGQGPWMHCGKDRKLILCETKREAKAHIPELRRRFSGPAESPARSKQPKSKQPPGLQILRDDACEVIAVSACTVRQHTEEELDSLLRWAEHARMDNLLVDMVLDKMINIEWSEEGVPKFSAIKPSTAGV